MELFKCPECARRFIVAEGSSELIRRCPQCRSDLTLVVRGIPGAPERISKALKARRLDAASPASDSRARKREAGE